MMVHVSAPTNKHPWLPRTARTVSRQRAVLHRYGTGELLKVDHVLFAIQTWRWAPAMFFGCFFSSVKSCVTFFFFFFFHSVSGGVWNSRNHGSRLFLGALLNFHPVTSGSARDGAIRLHRIPAFPVANPQDQGEVSCWTRLELKRLPVLPSIE